MLWHDIRQRVYNRHAAYRGAYFVERDRLELQDVELDPRFRKAAMHRFSSAPYLLWVAGGKP